MKIPVRIYYEDTDCGNVVYHANYLRYFERGRTELLRERGFSPALLHGSGTFFVVRKVEVEYLSPALYDDLLILDTRVSGTSKTSVTFVQSVRKEGTETEAVRGTVLLVMVDGNGKPARIPEELRTALQK